MNRRTLFGAIAAVASAGAFAAFPLHALAKPNPRCDRCFGPMPCDGADHINRSMPAVYLAGCKRVGDLEHDTWRHTTDPTWVHTFGHPADNMVPYEDRLAYMTELYNRSRWHG